jgi:hypothetical protein
MPVAERVRRAVTLLKAGYLGEPNGKVEPDPEATELLFDGVRRTVNAGVLNRPTTIQWDFTDAEPWHLDIDNGNTSVAPGRVPHPDLTFRSRFSDWVDLTAGRTDPLRALALGKIRPRGKLRMLLRARALFM